MGGIISLGEKERDWQPGMRIRQLCHSDQKGETSNDRSCSGEHITSFPAAASSLYRHMCGSLRGGIQITEKKSEKRTI